MEKRLQEYKFINDLILNHAIPKNTPFTNGDLNLYWGNHKYSVIRKALWTASTYPSPFGVYRVSRCNFFEGRHTLPSEVAEIVQEAFLSRPRAKTLYIKTKDLDKPLTLLKEKVNG